MRRFKFPFLRPDDIRRDIADELAHHLAESVAALERDGATPAEALAEARVRLGDVESLPHSLYQLDHRSMVRHRMRTALFELVTDLRFAWRRLVRRPVLAAATIITLALGIGTALTFAGAVDAILLRPLPVFEPDRIVTLWRGPADEPTVRNGLAAGTAMDLREEVRTITALSVAQPFSHDIERASERVSIGSWRVTDGFFDVLRVSPVAGRLPGRGDFAAGTPAWVVVSHRYWLRYLGGDAGVIGTYEQLDGTPHRIVAVLPPEFPYAEGRQLYVPLRVTSGPARENRIADYWSAYARLAPGASLESATNELRAAGARSDARAPASTVARTLHVIPLSDALLGAVRGRLMLLALAAFLLLLIAASNASSLLIADTMGRQRELAVRASVGAGRRRIARQLLTESLLLSIAAGGIGIGLATIGLRVFRTWAPSTVPRLLEVRPDMRLALVALLLTLVLTAIAGLASARAAGGTDLHSALKQVGGAGGVRGRRLRSALVTTQVAFAVLLLASGGLLLRSWIALTATHQGYSAHGVLAIENHIWGVHRTPAAQEAFGRALVARLAQLPGVAAAAVATELPLAPDIGDSDTEVRRDDSPTAITLHALTVSPGYFDALGIARLEGRSFTIDDGPNTEAVALVSRSASRRLFGTASPINATVVIVEDGVSSHRRIVGVVDDARYSSMESPGDASLYVPFAQSPTGSLYFVTRHRGDAAAALRMVQAAIRELMPSATLNETVLLESIQRDVATPRRFALLLLASFAVLAILLTAVGLFGLLAQMVRLRERELGVRLALGARPTQLRRLMMREGLGLAMIGTVAGLALFVLISGVLRGVVYGVTARDPVTIVGVTILMLVVAAGSSWWPATLATRVEPLRALRAD